LGINHINYIPYCPGSKIEQSVLSTVDLAITAGASHFVPSNINRIVDLGLKVLDISTVVEIIINLGLPLERINLFTLRYMKEFIDLNRKISDLKSRLETVLDASSNGIVALDPEENVVFMNKNSETFLFPEKPISVGDNIIDFIKNANLIAFVKDLDTRETDVFKINKKDVMVAKNYLNNGEKATGTVLSFSYVSEIQDIEKEIRKKLSNKGNVAKYDFSDIIGSSKSIRTATDMTKKVARTDLSVLLLGENGTGKELFAQAIHKNSARRDGPFVAVNFAALPENLIESELFGYEEGAFTGAKKGGKLGLFESAHRGTIFLDEIGDAPLSLQARLLRVIQEKEVLRVGGVSPIPVDVRIIAATNRNLKELITINLFRKDLYYRLNTITIRIPSLRERKEDIPNIMNYYMNTLGAQKTFSNSATRKLMDYNWPGNVRELQNLILFVVEIIDGDLVDIEDLPVDILGGHEDFSTIVDTGKDRREDIVQTVERHGDVRLFMLILDELEEAENLYQRVGRSYLVTRLSHKGVPVTANILRRVLKKLEELGCVNIGSTKQGTAITLIGKEILKKLKHLP
ncbi:MAG: sigma-54 interaction domain-containing protein, partial [Desulfitobacteriaceae bacterium]